MPFYSKYTGPLRTAARKKLSAVAIAVDAYFNYVTLLLSGDGTNAAQNNTFVDSSTNNFTITRNGNTTQGSFSPYGSNWSNFFPNASPATSYLVSSSVSLSGDFTIEGYVNWNGEGPNPAMFTLGDSSLLTGIEVYKSGANWILYASNGNRVTGSASVAGQWTYLAVTRSGTTVTFYINGISQGTWTSSQTFSGTIKVGAEFYGGTYYSSMSGHISNFRVNNTTAINTVPTAPLTAVSGTIFLTCQSNRFIDNSASPLTITVTGTPSVQRFNPFGTSTAYSTSVIGGSGYFDGTGDTLTCTGTLPATADFTLSLWVYPTSLAGYALAIQQAGSGNTFYLYLGYADGKTDIQVGSTNYNDYTAGVYKANQWNYVQVVKASSAYSFYVNGTALSVTSSTGNIGTTSIASGTLTVNYNTGCYITDVRIVNTALSNSVPTAPLTAVSGTTMLLSMQNGAIVDNSMMNNLETVGNAQISTAVSKFGTGSLYFDGTGDYLVIPSSPANQMGSSPFTIEMWIYPTTISGTHSLVGKYIGGSIPNSEYWLWITSTGRLAFAVDGSGAEDYIQSEVGTIVTNTWTHVVALKTAAAIALYINGTQVASAASAFTLSTNTTPLNIGAYNSGLGTYFGYIDDLRITKGLARYGGGSFTVPTAPFSNTGPI